MNSDKDFVKDYLVRISKIIKNRNMTKTAFCNAMGLSRNTFINWKKQNCLPNAITLMKISEYLNVSIDYLITGKSVNNKDELSLSSFRMGYKAAQKEIIDF